MSVVHSILLYGSEVWENQLRHEKYRKKLSSVQRRAALRVACAYRTVSEVVVLVIAKANPIELIANERKKLQQLRVAGEFNNESRQRERRATKEVWAES